MYSGASLLQHALGQDVARLDAVDGDAVAGELQRRGPDEAVDAGLGRRIVAVARARHARAGDRGGEDHAAGALRLHRPERRLRRQERALQVDREHGVPLLGRACPRSASTGRCRRSGPGCRAARARPAPRRRPPRASAGRRDVGPDEAAAEARGGRRALALEDVGDRQPRALLDEPLGDRLADAAGARRSPAPPCPRAAASSLQVPPANAVLRRVEQDRRQHQASLDHHRVVRRHAHHVDRGLDRGQQQDAGEHARQPAIPRPSG